jgi:retron-type reverse transcriptase
LHEGQGLHARAIFDLVVPLSHEDTAMRIEETAGDARARSCAVSPGSDPSGDVDSTNRSTPATPVTPGIRTSTTATRTTTTRTTSSEPGQSADRNDAAFSFAQFTFAQFTFEDLVAAYIDCRRTKRNTAAAIAFEIDLERLAAELRAGAYRPGPSICFVITRPKPREVWAAGFRDRIVHHLLYNRVGPRFERAFIADSCACIEGRGTLYAARRLEAKVRSITQNWNRPAWYLKADLANFFVTIDKRILARLLAAKIPETWWLKLAMQVLFHDPRPRAEIKATPAKLALIPPHKSLWNQPAWLGLPIGNLSSQFFANVYLDALDQHVKHDLRARRYVRYVDDFVLLHESPAQLNAWLRDIEGFVSRELALEVNPSKTIIQPIRRGIDFVGHVVKPWRRVIRPRTFNTAIERVAGEDHDDVHATVNSYFGLLRQASHSHGDRAQLARLVRRRGFAVDGKFTKAYP